MDSACYASSDNLIIGVRGGRVYKANPITGEILSQSDFAPVAFGASSIIYDSGVNRCFATAWNTNSHDFPNFRSTRTLYRITPSAVGCSTLGCCNDLTLNIQTLFTGVGLPGFINGAESGIANMRALSGQIYGVGWSGAINVEFSIFKFQANAPATNAFEPFSVDNNPQMCVADIGGHDRVYVMDGSSGSVDYWDFFDSSFNTSAPDTSRGYNAIEYAVSTGVLYVCREYQFIDIYTTGVDGGGNSPVYSGTTLDTGRSTFNGVNIRYNSFDGLLYVAGGADNTVIVINPAGPSIVPPNPRTGFDLPVDFVFTLTKKFAVQAGPVPLKEIT